MSLGFQTSDLSSMFQRSLPPTSTSKALVPYYSPFKNSRLNSKINFKSSYKGGATLARASLPAMLGLTLLDGGIELALNKYKELLAKRDALSSGSSNTSTFGDTTSTTSTTTGGDVTTPDAPTLDMPNYDGTTLTDILNNSGASIGEVAKQLQHSNALSSYNTDVSIAYSDVQLEQQLLSNELKKASLEDNQMSLTFQKFMIDKSLIDSEVDVAYKELDNAMQIEILNSLNNLVVATSQQTAILEAVASTPAPTVNVETAPPTIEVSASAPTVNVETVPPTIEVSTPAPTVNIDMSSVATAVNTLKDKIHPQSREDFYQKQNTIADHQTTPQTVTDLDGETVITDTPLNIKTKADATLAKKTTDENNLELEDDDFHMWDSLPSMDFLSNYDYSHVDAIS